MLQNLYCVHTSRRFAITWSWFTWKHAEKTLMCTKIIQVIRTKTGKKKVYVAKHTVQNKNVHNLQRTA